MQSLLLAANLLFLAANLSPDQLRSRAFSGVGTALLIGHFLTLTQPMLQVVGWNLLFLALNGVQIGRMLWSRRGPGALPA